MSWKDNAKIIKMVNFMLCIFNLNKIGFFLFKTNCYENSTASKEWKIIYKMYVDI